MSAWGDSWLTAWGTSWDQLTSSGSDAVIPPVPYSLNVSTGQARLNVTSGGTQLALTTGHARLNVSLGEAELLTGTGQQRLSLEPPTVIEIDLTSEDDLFDLTDETELITLIV